MSFSVVLGWVAAACGSVLSVPQLLHILRSRTSAGLSLLLWQLNLAISLGWTHHGLLVERLNVWVPNAMMALFSVLIVRLVIKDRALGAWPVWLLPLALAGVLCAIDLTLGALVYGIATAIPQTIGAGAQLVDVVLRRNIAGISPVLLAFGTLVQGLWLAWSLMVEKQPSRWPPSPPER